VLTAAPFLIAGLFGLWFWRRSKTLNAGKITRGSPKSHPARPLQ
jgi:hypothetical protein